MTEYRWEWCKPDRSGVWAFGGVHRTESKFINAMHVLNHSLSSAGWWCFLMPLPEILPPKRKTVWRMWVCSSGTINNEDRVLVFWYPDGNSPSRLDAIRTDKTEEREE